MSRASAFLWTANELASMVSQCARCRRKNSGAATCAAFPNGIPEKILDNEHDHSKPYPGDGGLTFLANEGVGG